MFHHLKRKKTIKDNLTHINDICNQLGSVDVKEDNVTCSGTFSINTLAIYTQDRDGDTLLHISIILLNAKLTMLFISKALSHKWLSFKNLALQSPLHLAVLTHQPEVVRRLVVGGTDVESRDKDGNTPLHVACRDGLKEIVNNLLEPVQYHETKQNTYEIPYQNIPQDFTIRNYEGLTCLHLAAMNKHEDIVKLLIDKGIDLNLKDGKTGRTILHYTCLVGNICLAKYLLREKSCDINARAYDRCTPFDLARDRGHDYVCVALAAAGARYSEDYENSDE